MTATGPASSSPEPDWETPLPRHAGLVTRPQTEPAGVT